MIRSYEAASTTIRRGFGRIEQKAKDRSPPAVAVLKGEEAGLVKVRRRNWARLIRQVWLDDPELWPKCGETMKLFAAISSPAQDEVIEKILRARGEWDPPWLRAWPTRRPPPSGGGPFGGATRIHYDEGCDPGQLQEDLHQDQDFGWEDA